MGQCYKAALASKNSCLGRWRGKDQAEKQDAQEKKELFHLILKQLGNGAILQTGKKVKELYVKAADMEVLYSP